MGFLQGQNTGRHMPSSSAQTRLKPNPLPLVSATRTPPRRTAPSAQIKFCDLLPCEVKLPHRLLT